jgi:restriction endonuclease Mrr
MFRNNGSGLENVVAEIYRDLGYKNVEQNIALSKTVNGEKINAQIDITYGSAFIKKYVECKSHSEKCVSLQDVAKFCSVLELFGIPTSRGEMITDSYFDTRAIKYAESKRISLVDGKGLKKLDEKRKYGLNAVRLGFRAYDEYRQTGLLGVLSYIFPRLLSLEQQKWAYMK